MVWWIRSDYLNEYMRLNLCPIGHLVLGQSVHHSDCGSRVLSVQKPTHRGWVCFDGLAVLDTQAFSGMSYIRQLFVSLRLQRVGSLPASSVWLSALVFTQWFMAFGNNPYAVKYIFFLSLTSMSWGGINPSERTWDLGCICGGNHISHYLRTKDKLYNLVFQVFSLLWNTVMITEDPKATICLYKSTCLSDEMNSFSLHLILMHRLPSKLSSSASQPVDVWTT